jgi:hypothetical protein
MDRTSVLRKTLELHFKRKRLWDYPQQMSLIGTRRTEEAGKNLKRKGHEDIRGVFLAIDFMKEKQCQKNRKTLIE